MVWQAVGAAIGAVGAFSSFSGQKKSAKAARRAARDQAKFTYETRMEEMRRSRRDIDQQMAYNEAAIYSSGLIGSQLGSARQALRATRAEMGRQFAWDRRSADLEKRAIEQGAPGGSVNRIATGQLVANIGSIITGLA